MQYRRDIDGLRAVAVVPVILFHAGFAGFGGGFLGVDVFFVISGYLITGILLEDHDRRGGISILRFYERRARRILPALFVVLAVTTGFAWIWLAPRAMVGFMESLGLTAVFLSNLYFMTKTGYFADSATLQPLLHTWSLAVEEQFYLIYPLLLLVVLRARPGAVRLVVLGLGALSLAFALWARAAYPGQTFFFPLSRAWQLLAGALVALIPAQPSRFSAPTTALGLGLIITAMALAGGDQPFPDPWAFATVIGTALILRHGGESGGWAARLLATPALVGIGLISYSAYLWHQPLFAFARARLIDAPPQGLILALAGLALGFGWLSWALVENPVRRRSFRPLASRGTLFGAAGVISLAFFGLGVAGYASGGFPGRVSPEVAAMSASTIYDPWRRKCDPQRQWGGEFRHPRPACGTLTPQHNVVLIGDSHAASLAGETMAALEQAGYGRYVATYGGCPAVPGLYMPGKPQPLACDAFARAAFAFAATVPDATVILALRWSLYVEGTRFDNGEGGAETGESHGAERLDRLASLGAADDPARRQRVLDTMVAAITALADHQPVILVYPVPEAGWNVPDRAAKLGMFATFPASLTTALARYNERNQAVIAAFDAIDHPNLTRVRPDRLLCTAGRCLNTAGTTAYYADSHHLAQAGAALVTAAIMRALLKISAAPPPR